MSLIRSLLGIRRRRGGVAVLILLLGLFACVSSCGLTVIAAPAGLVRGIQAGRLPQSSPEELATLTPGSIILINAQIPREAPTAAHGLALFYEEARTFGKTSESSETENTNASATDWRTTQAPPSSTTLNLSNGAELTVQIPANPSFLNAEIIDAPETRNEDGSREEARAVGYLPGQTLTIEGTWEGENHLTGREFFAGSTDDYLYYLRFTQPGGILLMGLFCGSVGIILLIIGGGLRILGR